MKEVYSPGLGRGRAGWGEAPGPCLAWVRRLRVRSLVVALLACLTLLPLCLYWLSRDSSEAARQGIDSADTARKVLGLIDFDHLSGPEIKQRIDELLRIKNSVQAELRRLEQRRAGMQQELQDLGREIEKVKMESSRETKELERLRVSIQQVKVAQEEYMVRNTPDIAPPLPLLAGRTGGWIGPPPPSSPPCSLSSCFDFSRCSVSSQLPVFVYPSDSLPSPLSGAVESLRQRTLGASQACLYIAVLSGLDSLPSLEHWAGDGRNHLLILADKASPSTTDTGRAMVASSWFSSSSWRVGFDLVLPSTLYSGAGWSSLPPLVPVTRPLLLTFQGNQVAGPLGNSQDSRAREVVALLKDMTVSGTSDKFDFTFACSPDPDQEPVDPGDWALCNQQESRLGRLEKATFGLILPPADTNLLSTPSLQARLLECLLAGTVPVVLSVDLALPYGEVVDWRRVAIILPTQRITELHFLLRTLPHSDIFALKRQGRLVLQSYLSSPRAIVESLLSVLHHRLWIPSPALPSTPSPSVFNSSFSRLVMSHLPLDVEPDESLGPLEPAAPSPSYKRNYSLTVSGSYHAWNTAFQPHSLTPTTPWEPLLPTEAKFHGSGLGFRPIQGGEGGAGAEFSQALGGNSPQEQFTVVMLTYEREQVLLNSLARLYGLPYLNKVVVVWNSPGPPSPELQWPDIGVPIKVVKTQRNSLNNRFLPYQEIDTEAVLSVDDDAHLRHDEIIFGFRVWREHRDRLVGFPGRFHAWDKEHNSWNYNSNYSCELSMVLTGAAFYHKYYSYVYTHTMDPSIRDMVDDFMNCEDLAMNFLISHLTSQPPIKVTSRWTFRCPGCPVSLSEDDSHFQERHRCINYFSQVYGYMPLLYTQFRADSVLFKTRIPPDKQKCFKFI